MKSKWMNVGFEYDELVPYIEPKPDLDDPERIGKYTIHNFDFASTFSNLTTISTWGINYLSYFLLSTYPYFHL